MSQLWQKRREDRFPTGPMIVVADDPALDERIRAEAAAGGLMPDPGARLLVLDVPADAHDVAALLFSTILTEEEQEQVFLLIEGEGDGGRPRLLGLRSVLARYRHSWFVDLLETGSLTSHLQPIVDLHAGAVHGFEALLRPRDRRGNPIAPDEALRVARLTAHLSELDQRARRAAFAAGARLSPAERLFVNVDAASFSPSGRELEETIALAHELPQSPDRIVFELVESESLVLTPSLDALLARLRAEGFTIALDDLGSGFSTLGVLDRIRPDVVKLDQRLVRGAHADLYRGRLVRAFVDLAADLDLELVAEGIETDADLDFVRRLGIRFAQGFLLGRPAAEPLRRLPVLLQEPPPLHSTAPPPAPLP